MIQYHVIAEKMLLNLVTTLSSVEFKKAWYSDKSYIKHVAKRIDKGDIVSEADYKAKTLHVIANADTLIVVIPDSGLLGGKLQITIDSWIVLIGEDGKIVTSYPFDPNKVSFEQRHKEIGDIVYEYVITERIKKLLKRVWIASEILGSE